MSNPTIDRPAALGVLQDAMDSVVATQGAAISQAALLCTDALAGDGIIQAFGTGHSRSFTMEIAGRAGGLDRREPTVHQGPRHVRRRRPERDPRPDRRTRPRPRPAGSGTCTTSGPRTCFLIASNSGINGAVVEMARLARDNGNPVVAVTSLAHSASEPSRHPSGARLLDLADVVIDNRGVPGDAGVALPGGARIVPTSTMTSVLVAQLLTAEICLALTARGIEPPVYLSANVDGGDAHNEALRARYAGRLRRHEP